MEEEKDDKPSQLVKILRKMPYLEARWILADMDKDLQFDRHVLSSIANGLFELRTFFKDFTESTMQEILPSVPDSSLAYIIKTEARYQTDVKRVLGKDRYFRIEKTEADDEEIAKNNIISAIHTALSEKRLSYHSILLLLKVGPCTKKVFLNREPIHLQMRVLNQMYKPGDMLDVLIYSPDLAGQKAQIFTLKSDSGKEDKRIMFRFDKSGFYFKQIHSGIDPIGFIGLSVPS
ncbi:MAG: hypothetical protein KDK45_04685, partial [Leptospiraceae bacterium]|nr:hypothetical protein [Leptospiraceae bacterium]